MAKVSMGITQYGAEKNENVAHKTKQTKKTNYKLKKLPQNAFE
jgi:hypothetical protein